MAVTLTSPQRKKNRIARMEMWKNLQRHAEGRSEKQKTTLMHSQTGSSVLCTLLFEPASLLDEAHEWSNSSPRADHDHRVDCFERQTELRPADVHGNGGLVAVISDHFVLKPVCGDSLVGAASFGLILHHHRTDVYAVGVNLQNTTVRLMIKTRNSVIDSFFFLFRNLMTLKWQWIIRSSINQKISFIICYYHYNSEVI